MNTLPLPTTDVAPPSLLMRTLRCLLQIAGYTLGFLLLLSLTFLVLHIPPAEALRSLWTGAFGDAQSGHLASVSNTLIETTPLVLTGLGVVVAWRAGLFSIGGEGQLLMGALAATALAKVGAHLPAPLLTVLMVLVATLAGAVWGALAGWLRVRRNVQEVISTIMLNYVAKFVVSWLVLGVFQEHTHHNPQSESLPNVVLFARLLPRQWSDNMQTSLHGGIFLALLAVLLITVALYRTPMGFGLRVMGQNAEAARAARFPVDALRMKAMAISGGLCGLAGVIELLGSSTGSLPANDFSSGWGYTAVPVALLGGLHPGGTLLSALFFGALTAGCRNLSQFQAVPTVLIYLVQGMAVLAIVGGRTWRARRTGSETE
ncbi:MAG: nucleoside transporter rane protein [Chthonomonadales bacterium]|nr:nucleoside transporter rane protein [Chthonomonadales bacterium]